MVHARGSELVEEILLVDAVGRQKRCEDGPDCHHQQDDEPCQRYPMMPEAAPGNPQMALSLGPGLVDRVVGDLLHDRKPRQITRAIAIVGGRCASHLTSTESWDRAC